MLMSNEMVGMSPVCSMEGFFEKRSLTTRPGIIGAVILKVGKASQAPL